MSALLAAMLLLIANARAEVLDSAPYYERSDPSAFKAELTVSFVLVRGGGWTRAQAERQFEQLARVFAQCRLRFTDAELHELAPPAGTALLLKRHPGLRGSIEELARANPSVARPAFYLIEGVADADDAGPFSHADFEGGYHGEPVLLDSVFMPYGVNEAVFEEQRRVSPYGVAAHELWHVLTRVGGHYDESPGHLGNGWLTRSDFITPRDCDRVLASPLVKPYLLKSRS
jgi:hypothetical protein